jgi:hypothetical protein
VTIPGNTRVKSYSKKLKKVTLTEPVENERANNNSKVEDFLICNDCRHNTITYEPSNDGACSCGCH